MDPLVRFKDAHSKGIISDDDVFDLTMKRFPLVIAGISRIEKASGIRYPMQVLCNLGDVDLFRIFAE